MKATLVEFVKKTYLTIVGESYHHYIYRHDPLASPEDSEGGGDIHIVDEEDEIDVVEEKTIQWDNIVNSMVTQTTTGFDRVSVITQGGLNAQIRQLWEAARIKLSSLPSNVKIWSSKSLEVETNLAEFGYAEDEHIFFRASFAPPQIQLLVKESGRHQAIFFVQIKEGSLKTLGKGKSLASG